MSSDDCSLMGSRGVLLKTRSAYQVDSHSSGHGKNRSVVSCHFARTSSTALGPAGQTMICCNFPCLFASNGLESFESKESQNQLLCSGERCQVEFTQQRGRRKRRNENLEGQRGLLFVITVRIGEIKIQPIKKIFFFLSYSLWALQYERASKK